VYTRILVPLDGSETAWHALETALQLAASTGAALHALYVIDVPVMAFYAPGFAPSIISDYYHLEGRRVPDRAEARMKERGVTGTARIEDVDPCQDVAERILLAAADAKADLIVIGTHGRRGLSHLLLGSVAERVVRTAECPVLTTRG
jgi:nucleotide-binding universal stress UspA family protein